MIVAGIVGEEPLSRGNSIRVRTIEWGISATTRSRCPQRPITQYDERHLGLSLGCSPICTLRGDSCSRKGQCFYRETVWDSFGGPVTAVALVKAFRNQPYLGESCPCPHSAQPHPTSCRSPGTISPVIFADACDLATIPYAGKYWEWSVMNTTVFLRDLTLSRYGNTSAVPGEFLQSFIRNIAMANIPVWTRVNVLTQVVALESLGLTRCTPARSIRLLASSASFGVAVPLASVFAQTEYPASRRERARNIVPKHNISGRSFFHGPRKDGSTYKLLSRYHRGWPASCR